MKPQYTHKLSSARQNIKRAIKYLYSGGSTEQVFKKTWKAYGKIIRAWLIKNGQDWPHGQSQITTEGLFYSLAPDYLEKKRSLITTKISTLSNQVAYSPHLFPDATLSKIQWEKETFVLLSELLRIINHVQLNTPLGSFRGEVNWDYKPGQLVNLFSIGEKPDGSKFWRKNTKKILAVKRRSLILRGYQRTLGKYDKNEVRIVPASLPSPTPESTFERRRRWFDLHPEYRQNPLYFKNKRDYQHSRYYTCPCCGYPVLNTHPAYCMHGLDESPHWYEICRLCDWADVVDEFPGDQESKFELTEENFDISLTEARKNFDKYSCMFHPGQGPFFNVNTEPEVLALKRSIRSCFNLLMEENNQWKAYLLWHRAQSALRGLSKLLRHMEEAHPVYKTTQRDEEGMIIGRMFENKWEYPDEHSLLGTWGISYGLGICKIIWLGSDRYGNSYIVRLASGKEKDTLNSIGGGLTRNVSCINETINRPPDDETTPRALRRNWFDRHHGIFSEKFVCPCCGFPTLSSLANLEVCYLCGWLDTGQDDFEATEYHPSINGGFSLMQARENFENYDGIWPPGTSPLLSGNHLNPEIRSIKKEIVKLYYQIQETNAPHEENKLREQLEKDKAKIDKARQAIAGP